MAKERLISEREQKEIDSAISTWYQGDKLWGEFEETCDRCGGAGASEQWRFTGMTCYKCGGRGKVNNQRRILSDKEIASRERARVRKAEREKEKRDAERGKLVEAYTKLLEGSTYIANHPDTYSIKEELKSSGATYNHWLGWHWTTEPTTQYDYVTIPNTELYRSLDDFAPFADNNGNLIMCVREVVRVALRDANRVGKPVSSHVGEVGDKLEMELTVINKSSFERESYAGYGTDIVKVVTLKDSDGNKYVWFTTSIKAWESYEEGKAYVCKFTVKAHDEFDGELQTSIIRTRIVKEIGGNDNE